MSAEIIAFRKREKPKDKPAAPPPSRRLDALDAMRGLCVVGMILLTGFAAPGAKAHGFDLDHLVPAGFLLCMGMAIPLSLAARAARQSRGQLMLHIGVRTAILVGLGLALSNVPALNSAADFAHPQVTGPLQYAGLCYGVAGLLCLSFGRKSDADFTLKLWPVAAAVVVALGLYSGLLFAGWPVAVGQAGFDLSELTKGLGALAVVLLGVMAALLVRRHGVRNVAAGLAFLGALLFVAGGGLANVLPVNGDLWTPAFAVIAGGVALVVFALVAAISEIPGVKFAAYPLRVFGGNALLAFAVTTLAVRLWPQIGVTTPLAAAALLPGIGLPLWGLYRKRIYLVP
jgi:predicted acyltransferase